MSVFKPQDSKKEFGEEEDADRKQVTVKTKL